MTFLTLLIIAVNTGLAIYLAYIKRRDSTQNAVATYGQIIKQHLLSKIGE